MAMRFLDKTNRSKLCVLLALLTTTAVGSTIIALSATRTYSTGSLVDWVQRDRAAIQIIVQLISATLAALQLYALSSFVLFRTNLHLLSKPMSLDTLKLHQALHSRAFDPDLSLQSLVLSLAYIAALQAPAAIWAGAITPVRTRANVSAVYSIPLYSQSEYGYWGRSCRPATGCDVLQNTTQLGTFTNVPWKCEQTFLVSLGRSRTDFCSLDLPGLLLNSVRDASSRNSSVSQHKKLDNSGFSFHGRSYGVGSGVGLISPNTTQYEYAQRAPQITSYSFSEAGYLSHVLCTYNKSSNLSFEQLDMVQGGDIGSPTFSGTVVVYQAVGSLPTGVWQGFTTMSIVGPSTAVALAAVADDTRYFYGFIGGSLFYADLNNIQCEATFSPTTFNVAVDVLAQNISVTASTIDVPSSDDIDSTGGLIYNAFMGVSFLSQILTTMYTGVLGDAFILNIDAVQNREGHQNRTQSDITTGLAESLELLLDEYLGSVAASQLILLHQSQPVNVTTEIQVVTLGEPVYAYISFFINLAILGLFLFECFRTRFWKNLPSFNCLDAKSAILGTAASDREHSQKVQNWEGDPADSQVGRLKVMLQTNKPVLELLSPAGGDSVPGLDEPVEAVPLGRIHSQQDMHLSQQDTTHLLLPGENESRRFGWAIT